MSKQLQYRHSPVYDPSSPPKKKIEIKHLKLDPVVFPKLSESQLLKKLLNLVQPHQKLLDLSSSLLKI